MSYMCPICGYPDLSEQPYDDFGASSHEICPSCGVEFGYEDNKTSYSELRKRWIEAGAKWWASEDPPDGWDGAEQLKNVDKEVG